ncbi:DegT/DnrJ/EryC1/StrS family aminotransferase [bacterium (Candidatus Blackallbacteria) CG17_big_fil_post_rev_8_21_14_2_50_48_46]|uniref:DegT/DnrJ/EryC1/StrS family aminotransferase n=1 Tax=bacterium (Candidatus Blackallbacteria) CG17_big_fil_post_rev_8_21_14_2_50_48_46 TaxID=2014261 RepID=A0A2M7GAA9_9BACT|nr:MAG: cell wall biogenesis protein [bacterium (Candidatus Blackallbacteria) CG18_big_fil_WC_8_21_14_2_50_49_26]PIW19083.1 MAG: DegT/DnrJ/EryC1/StrS family aminotransferase [bacterium (Candidatus Blackallbacteria) CG17_big_fil_post_rev_8_21_14_2_50_48_46]PIW44550.1 MAG: DegT/DnrJ/EryC1/StrS family aminotransferase [bacterium (Candidatus Blackallbacteria) CG13_big_fil_rev_8_21_14_2_50_49_14]
MPRSIPYVDLARQHAPLKNALLEAVSHCLDEAQFILGPAVERFEKAFAPLCQTEFAIGLNSGTDALILALKALKIGAGDEVIVPPNSFIASATAVILAGATPIFADVGEDYNLDPACVERALSPRTRAIMPVHLTGRPAKMDALLAIAKAHQLEIIEDSAQAILAEYQGQKVGSFGRMGCFSLHPLKTLNACGDGGAISTSDPELNAALRISRNLGLRTRDDCVEWSGNSRLDSLQAAMLEVKLRYLQTWTEQRRTNAQLYRQLLADLPEIQLPSDSPDIYQVYHTFVIQAQKRDQLKHFLQEKGIGTSIHYPIPIHLHKAAKDLGHQSGDFPVAEKQAQQILSLPIYPELDSEDQIYIAEQIQAFYEKERV